MQVSDLGGASFASDRNREMVHHQSIRHVNFGGGIKGMEGYLKQEKLREKVEQMQDARAKAERYAAEKEMKKDSSSDQPHPPPWEAPPPPMGVQAMAEARITEALSAGVFDDLAGKGKPLTRDSSTETPWQVDAGQAALNRVLKVAGYKPKSVGAMERLKLTAEVLGKVLGRKINDGVDVQSALLDKDLNTAYDDKANAVKQYNQSLIVDQEQYGSGWPLVPAKIGTLEEHVRDALK